MAPIYRKHFLREAETAHKLGVSVWTLRAWRRKPHYGPLWTKCGRIVWYAHGSVQNFLVSRLMPRGGSVQQPSAFAAQLRELA
jgi:hypothetical protein